MIVHDGSGAVAVAKVFARGAMAREPERTAIAGYLSRQEFAETR